MPTYLYACPTHGEFEWEHSIKEQLKECPLCVEEDLTPQETTRLIPRGTGFILNGGGWASEGYASK